MDDAGKKHKLESKQKTRGERKVKFKYKPKFLTEQKLLMENLYRRLFFSFFASKWFMLFGKPMGIIISFKTISNECKSVTS